MTAFSKKLICMFMLAVMLALTVTSVSFAASEDYEMSEPWWDITQEGSIIGRWDSPAKSTDYEVRLFIEGKKQSVFSKNMSGTSYDFSDVILEQGRKNYYFTVLPKKGGRKYRVTSDILEVDSAMTKAIKNLQKADEEAAKKLGPVTIKKLELKLTEEKVTPGEMKPISFADQAKYKVRDVAFSKQYADWVLKEQITVTMTIEPQKDYLFADNMTIVCDKADSVSMTGSGQSRSVTVKYSPYVVLAKPDNLYLTSDGKLHWDKVQNATSYQVEFVDSGETLENVKVTSPVIDVSNYLDSGISIRIRSQNKSQSYYYMNSSKLVIEDIDSFADENTVPGVLKASGGRIRYIPDDEAELDEIALDEGKTGAGWKQLAGHWYHFDGKGYAAGPGWWQDTANENDPNHAAGGSWYYFDENCRMLVNTTTPDGCRVDENGRWVR